MNEFAELLGWLVAAAYAIALLNYPVKYLNKRYFSKAQGNNTKYKKGFNILKKYIIKYHKLAGILAALGIIIHFIIMYNINGLSISGLVSASLMWIIAMLGAYGVRISKNYKAPWLKFHRAISVLPLISIVIHVLTKV